MAIHRTTIAVFVIGLLLCLPLRASAAPAAAPLPVLQAQADQPQNQPIPGLLGPVRLVLPWVDPNTGEIIGFRPLPSPTVAWYDVGSWINWLGVQLWNRIACPVIVWTIGIVQGSLNLLQTVINLLLVPGVNAVWRLYVRVILWINLGLSAVWSLIETVRRYVWQGWRALEHMYLQLGALIDLARGLVGVLADVLSLIGTGFLAVMQIIGYVLGFVLAAVPVLFDAIANPVEPKEVSIIKESIIFQLFLAVVNGFVDSKLGWAWYAFIGISYIKFVKWIVVEAGSLNT